MKIKLSKFDLRNERFFCNRFEVLLVVHRSLFDVNVGWEN
jgi:hypothetical protein